MTGLLASPGMIVYTATGKDTPVSVTGLLAGAVAVVADDAQEAAAG